MATDLIVDSRHPSYNLQDSIKYRLTYQGGRPFIEKYLKKFDTREDKKDFCNRLEISHNPGFAAEAVDEVRTGITQRMSEITRTVKSESYNKACDGKNGGVDQCGSSMNVFLSEKVLRELLSMGRVGVYVDMPKFNPEATLAEFSKPPHPYLYTYRYEDILNWQVTFCENELVYTVVLLRETYWETNAAGLPQKQKERFRLVRLLPEGGVLVQFMEKAPDANGVTQENVTHTFKLEKLTRIPFEMLDIGKSLLVEASDYQIGLLNLASSDLMYGIHSNFPFYVEGYDPKAEATYLKQGPQTGFDADGNPIEKQAAESEDSQDIPVGTMHGRRYPMEAKPPQFIHPSSDPLRVSMEKQEAMKADIRRLLNLALSNVAPSRASAESKKVDQHGLESGLSGIGQTLKYAEEIIARLWCQYEGVEVDDIQITYPATFSLKSDNERIAEAKELKEVQGSAPSKTFQKEVAKLIAAKLLQGKVTQEKLIAVMNEIEAAKYSSSDPDTVIKAVEGGMCDAETGAEALGFDPAIVEKAQKERVQRLADTAIAQSQGSGAIDPARGTAPGSGKGEKTVSQNPDRNLPGQSKKRGKAK